MICIISWKEFLYDFLFFQTVELNICIKICIIFFYKSIQDKLFLLNTAYLIRVNHWKWNPISWFIQKWKMKKTFEPVFFKSIKYILWRILLKFYSVSIRVIYSKRCNCNFWCKNWTCKQEEDDHKYFCLIHLNPPFQEAQFFRFQYILYLQQN